MRASALTLGLVAALPTPSLAALGILDWLYPGTSVTVSADVVPHKVAVIGAGAAGSSAAFFLNNAATRSGVQLTVDVFEKSSYIGGRSTVVYPFNDTTLDPIELGASIFVAANKNLVRAVHEFNLSTLYFDDDDEDASTGFWDGEQFVFVMNESSGIAGWFNSIKAIWRYGYKSPIKVKKLVGQMIDDFLSFYTPSSPTWSNITDLASQLGWKTLVAQSASEYLDLEGISPRFSREVVEAATRVNYGQDLDKIHALEGLVSVAASGASSVVGGNFQIFEQFLARSCAKMHLNTTVVSLSEKNGAWTLKTADGESETYDDIILAAPYHSTGLSVTSGSTLSSIFGGGDSLNVPPQPYVHLHVTLIATTAPQPNPAYFGLKPGSKVPRTVLTTAVRVREGGKEPEFNSLSYHGPVVSGRREQVVKIFSKERLEDEWLQTMFEGQVDWVFRKEWDAYPYLPPTTDFPPVVLAPNLYYVNAFEPFISTMETETISARNVVDQLFRARFGTDICGKSVSVGASDHSQTKEEVGAIVGADGEQIVLQETQPLPTPSPDAEAKAEAKAKVAEEGFVLGWDCL